MQSKLAIDIYCLTRFIIWKNFFLLKEWISTKNCLISTPIFYELQQNEKWEYELQNNTKKMFKQYEIHKQYLYKLMS